MSIFNSIERPAKEFRQITSQVNYRRTKVWINASETVTLMDLNWSGGTRSTYTVFELATMEKVTDTQRYSSLAPWNNKAEGVTLPIPPGFAVFQHGDFCGKPGMGTLYVHPSNMPALIAA